MDRKIRYEWVDNAKVIAIFLILTHHLLSSCSFGGTFGNHFLYRCIQDGPLSARVSFFFVASGYFLAQNITWRKAFSRFYTLLISLLIWNSIYALLTRSFSFAPSWLIPNLLGINGVINHHLYCIFGSKNAICPIIGPSWFLKDLAFLALTTPFICKWRKYIPIFAAALCFLVVTNVRPDATALFSPGTVSAYAMGCWLSRYPLPHPVQYFDFKITILFIVCSLLSLSALVLDACHLFQAPPLLLTVCGSFISIVLIAHCGVLIEKYVPALSKRISACAPAFYLVFLLHFPLIIFFKSILPGYIWNSWWILLLIPIPLTGVLVLFHHFIVRFAPSMAPYLCNAKIKATNFR